MSFDILDATNVSGTLLVRQDTTLTSSVEISGTLIVSGLTTILSSLNVSGQIAATSGIALPELSTYCFSVGQTSAGPAATVIFDLFNSAGSGRVIRLVESYAYISPSAAITGSVVALEGYRTSSVGTGGSVITEGKFDTSDGSLPAQITARSRPTGGAATKGNVVFGTAIYTEEASNAATQAYLYQNYGYNNAKRFTLRAGEGFKVVTGPLLVPGLITLVTTITLE